MRHVVLMVAVVIAVSCGGGSEPVEQAAPATSPPRASASFDPCSLMTREEVQAAVGWTVTQTKPIPQGALGHCVYSGEGMTAEGPREVDLGIGVCFSNMPCGAGLPAFASSAELAAYRRKGYEGSTILGDLKPTIEPVEGLGVPAIRHELAGQKSVELGLGRERLAYVELWGSFDAALALAKQLLTRVPK